MSALKEAAAQLASASAAADRAAAEASAGDIPMASWEAGKAHGLACLAMTTLTLWVKEEASK